MRTPGRKGRGQDWAQTEVRLDAGPRAAQANPKEVFVVNGGPSETSDGPRWPDLYPTNSLVSHWMWVIPGRV